MNTNKKTTYLKLVTGTYVIGELNERTDNIIKINKPYGVEFNPMAGGLAMVPYDAFYLNDELKEIEIKSEHIMHEFKAPEELEAKYFEMRSGIVTNPGNQGLNPDQMTDELMQQLASQSGLITGDK